MSGLPSGWAEATLGELVASNGVVTDGDWVESKDQDPNGEVRLTQLADIGDGEFRNRSDRYLNLESAERLGCTFLEAGDVLIARMPDPLGRACVFPGLPQPAVTVVDVLVYRSGTDLVSPHWIMAAINAPETRQKIIAQASGTTRQRISGGNLKRLPLPLPPLAEQKRIVAKLDALNAKSARARTELARIATLVSRYKQAVLSKAFSEELTQDWQVVSLDLLSETVFDGPFGSNLKSADYTPDGPRVVRLENIGTREFIEEKRTHISEEKFRSLARHTLQANDLLFSSFVSEEIRACLFPSNAGFRAVNKADCFCIRLDKAKIDPKFALLQLTTEATYRYFVQQVHGATRPRINLSQLKHYPLVVPPLDEQHAIVRRIETTFARIEGLVAEAKRALVLVGRLDEAILAKAFHGELVPQDPNDEPASALIERVGAWPTGVIERGQGRPAKNVERAVRRGGGMTATASPLTKVADAMTAQQKDSSMSKTRQDPDVMGQPYLSKILRKQPGAGTVDTLFKAADLPVADFYKQLAWEIENQHILDKQDGLEAA
ncbi:restriction endonuclease subunit S [Bosea sp. (in: a-proteobacteria)]|jgi:type I restriction enzyme S subunit|uniref:restriction endonuclease subunit S n=1 Tax=Bosea sp. (in: a-proteobacteria) TaxID=1871050 RepID=UPI003F71563F